MQKLKGMMLCITKIHNIFTKLYLIEGELKKHSQTKSVITLKDKLWKMGGEKHKMGGRQSENSQTQESLLAPGVPNKFILEIFFKITIIRLGCSTHSCTGCSRASRLL